MRKLLVVALALSGAVVTCQAASFADAVVEYQPGTGFAPRFTNSAAALGAPSQVNPFDEPTDPFNPPYGTEQIVSLGAGGSLTLRFGKPMLNHPNNPFGLDFILFGNPGFIITNEFSLETFEWIGIPATDGSLFGASAGETRVSVSRDGVTFFTLDPAVAPTVDSRFPTDGAGDPHQPVVPWIESADFAGLDLDGIRELYAGSAGGMGYDIGWARDAAGRPVRLPEINYVRVEVLTGKSEIDACASVFTPSHPPQRFR